MHNLMHSTFSKIKSELESPPASFELDIEKLKRNYFVRALKMKEGGVRECLIDM